MSTIVFNAAGTVFLVPRPLPSIVRKCWEDCPLPPSPWELREGLTRAPSFLPISMGRFCLRPVLRTRSWDFPAPAFTKSGISMSTSLPLLTRRLLSLPIRPPRPLRRSAPLLKLRSQLGTTAALDGVGTVSCSVSRIEISGAPLRLTNRSRGILALIPAAWQACVGSSLERDLRAGHSRSGEHLSARRDLAMVRQRRHGPCRKLCDWF